MKEYISLSQEHQAEYIIEKSRFIATAAPCQSEDDAQSFIHRISKKYWDATHNCTAFCLGPNQEQQRSSDNGEPAGTAGKPMLEVLRKTGITNTVVVVSRYFGGIKLGAGGLIRAYSHSTSLVLSEAPKTLYAPRIMVNLISEYPFFSTIEQYLREKGYTYSSQFLDTVHLSICLPPEDIEVVQKDIKNITNGTALLSENLPSMVAIPLP